MCTRAQPGWQNKCWIGMWWHSLVQARLLGDIRAGLSCKWTASSDHYQLWFIRIGRVVVLSCLVSLLRVNWKRIVSWQSKLSWEISSLCLLGIWRIFSFIFHYLHIIKSTVELFKSSLCVLADVISISFRINKEEMCKQTVNFPSIKNTMHRVDQS